MNIQFIMYKHYECSNTANNILITNIHIYIESEIAKSIYHPSNYCQKVGHELHYTIMDKVNTD